MWNPRLDKSQAEIKIAGRSISSLRYADDTTLMAESRETKESLDEGERGEWKSWVKTQHSENEDHGIRPHYFMANKWGNNGNSERLCFLGLQNHYKWWLLPWNLKTPAPWKKNNDKPRQHIKKQRHYFAKKFPIVTAMIFPVIMCGWIYVWIHVWIWELDHKEGWGPSKNWCFWTVMLEKTLEIPWTARRSNQSILKEISPEYSLGRLMLKLQYFGDLMWRANSFEKTLMLGKIEVGRRRGWQRMRWLNVIIDSMDMSLSKLWDMVKDREPSRAVVHGVTKNQTQPCNWIATIAICLLVLEHLIQL